MPETNKLIGGLVSSFGCLLIVFAWSLVHDGGSIILGGGAAGLGGLLHVARGYIDV